MRLAWMFSCFLVIFALPEELKAQDWSQEHNSREKAFRRANKYCDALEKQSQFMGGLKVEGQSVFVFESKGRNSNEYPQQCEWQRLGSLGQVIMFGKDWYRMYSIVDRALCYYQKSSPSQPDSYKNCYPPIN